MKVQRPGIGENIAIDMVLLRRLMTAFDAALPRLRLPIQARPTPVGVSFGVLRGSLSHGGRACCAAAPAPALLGVCRACISYLFLCWVIFRVFISCLQNKSICPASAFFHYGATLSFSPSLPVPCSAVPVLEPGNRGTCMLRSSMGPGSADAC